jgi:anti-sigma factor RsiW
MTDAPVLTDEDLTAYLDGQCDPETEARISAQLETDDALVERLGALDIPIAAIRQGYDALLADAPPMPDLTNVTSMPAAARTAPWRGFGMFGAGLAAGLAIMAVAGQFQSAPGPAPAAPLGWKAVVANYQMLYDTKTLYPETPSAETRAAQLAHVGRELNMDLSGLEDAPGLTFKRAQILSFQGRPLAQIAYLKADGTPVALCILESKDGRSGKRTDVAYEVVGGLGGASWTMNGIGYIVIGGDDPAALTGEAAHFASWSTGVT